MFVVCWVCSRFADLLLEGLFINSFKIHPRFDPFDLCVVPVGDVVISPSIQIHTNSAGKEKRKISFESRRKSKVV